MDVYEGPDPELRMMRSRVVIVICLLTLTALSFCDYPTLNSISDLIREVPKGSVPSHAVILLHWFANNIEMDNNNRFCFAFDPNQDFDSHQYGNLKHLLDTVDENVLIYFTQGSVNRLESGSLADYTPNVQFVEDDLNVNHIILCASRVEQNTDSRSISQVYLTRHFQQQTQRNSAYDNNLTFIISDNLLSQLRQFVSNNNTPSLDELRNLTNQFNNNINDNQLRDLTNTWLNEARLGLLLLIVSPGSYGDVTELFVVSKSKSRFSRDLTVSSEWENCEEEDVRVTTGDDGYAKISWRNVPQKRLNDGVAVVLFKNQDDNDAPAIFKKITSSQGNYDTNVLLNEGLQARLYKTNLWWPSDEICRGKELKSPVAPLDDVNVQLQLFVRDGKACFRLYVKSGGYNYIYEHYYKHYVALYRNGRDHSVYYLSGQWQWVINFEQGRRINAYDTFEYCTSTTITTGLQARIVQIELNFYVIYACTNEWSDQAANHNDDNCSHLDP